MPAAKLISITKDPMDVLKTAAGMCYQKKATDKVIQHIIDAGHLSVLEHCYATFEVTCSIVVLLQLTRHRHLSFTCQSSRATELKDVYTPIGNLECMIEQEMELYHKAIESGIPPEEAAYLIPKCAEYHLVVSGNFRAWFEYLPKRLCHRASDEHRELAQMIADQLYLACPEVFKNVKLNCGNCKESGCGFAGR